MSIIEEIYRNRIDEKHRLLSERELDNHIHEMLKRESYLENEPMSNLFFEAADYGQQEGFCAGIRFTIALLAECLL